jgi:hypothetical protein
MRGKPADAETYEVTTAPQPSNPGPFDDIPPWIWKAYMFGWIAVFGLFVMFFTTDGGAAFAITVAVMFVMMAFGLPMTIAAVGRSEGHQRNGVIQTATGPMGEGAAAVQIALIPIAAAFGLVAFILLAK